MNTKHILSRSVATLLALTPLLAPGAADTLTGTGGTVQPGVSWAAPVSPSAWSLGTLPGTGDNAVIAATGLVDIRGSAAAFNPTLTLGTTEIQDLTFNSTAAVTLNNNSTSRAMLLILNGGRGPGVPLISTVGNFAYVIQGPGSNTTTPQPLSLQLNASGDISVAANVLTISAVIAESGGARSITKTGAGTLTLSGATANTFTGTTTVSGGTLVLSKTSGINAIGGNLIVALGGTVAYGTTAGQLADQIPDTASITINGGTFGSGVGATLAAPTAGVTDTVASVTVNSGSFLSGRNSLVTPFNVTGLLKIAGGTALVQRGGGLSANAVEFTGGALNLDGGSTTAGQQSKLNVGAGGLTMAGTTINFNAGPSAFTATTSVGSIVNLAGDVTATGTSTFVRLNTAFPTAAATVDLGGGVRTFNVAGSLTIGTAAAQVVVNNGGLIKTGSGTLTLGSTNGLAGAMTVSAGSLVVAGSVAAGTAVAVSGTGTLTVTGSLPVGRGVAVSSGGTLTGTGTVTDLTTVTGGGKIQPGDALGAGTLALGTLTLGLVASDTATLNLTTTSQINVTGTNGLVCNGGAGTVTVNLGGATPALGTYTLIDYVGAIGGTGFGAFQLGPLPSRLVASLVDNTGNTSIDLSVTGFDFPIWKGSQSSEWSTATIAPAKNWVLNSNNATGTDFITSDSVTFSDLATATTVDVSVADVSVAAVLFSNATKNYVIGGTKAIAGSGTFTVSGAGKVTVNNTNSFTGAVTMNAGTLSVATVANGGLNSPLGAGTALAFGGGTLEFTGASGSTDRAVTLNAGGGTVKTDTLLTLAGAIGGTGALTKTGSGTLILTGANSYGATTFSTGTLQVGDGVAAGSLGTGLVTNNTTLVFNTPAAGVTVSAEITGSGALTKSGAGGNTVLSGTVANSFSGTTTVSAGNLILSKTSGLNAIGGNLIVALGGTVSYGTTAGQLADHIPDSASITINGGTFGSGAGATPAAPTQGVSDTVASVTVNSGSFLSGRGGTSAAPLPFVVTGAFNLLGGTALVSRGGALTAGSVQVGAVNLDLDGGSATANNQSKLNVGAGGLTLAGSTINLNAGPSVLSATSVGSIVTLGGNVVSTGASSLVRLNPTAAVAVATVDLGAATRTFNVTGTLTIGTAAAPITITNGALTKTGTGVLNLTGPQTYATLQTDGGVTNLRSALGTGTSTLNANAAANIFASQTLAALNIGNGAEVTFGDGLALVGEPEKFGAPALVPEPGALGLLLVAGLGLLGRRRR